MLKTKSVKVKKVAPAQDGTAVKKKKKQNVKEIDGVTWLLDDDGKPLKKVRKKGTEPERKSPVRGRSPGTGLGSGGAGAAGAGAKPKAPKKNVVEIDGQLFLLDENGKPSKKIRRKGDKIQRSASQGPLGKAARGRTMVGNGAQPRRAQSLNRGLLDRFEARTAAAAAAEPKETIDSKGRRIITEEDGTKTIIDKNGKRLRPKKKPSLVGTTQLPTSSGANDDDLGFLGGEMFDQLWGDEEAKTPTATAKSDKCGQAGGQDTEANPSKETTSLSEKISTLGKENRELSLKLQEAEEKSYDLAEQNKKEKAKNVKAMTEIMQLKADYTESSSQVQTLKSKVKDLTSTMDTKDQQIVKLRETIEKEAAARAAAEGSPSPRPSSQRLFGGGGGGGGSPAAGGTTREVDELFAENRGLQRKLEFERSNAQQESKKQEDKIAFMTKELASLRDEMEMLLRGETGNIVVNPTYVRMLDEKKKLAYDLEQTKEVYEIRVKSMEESIFSLEDANRGLKKQLRDNGITPEEKTTDLGIPSSSGGGGGNTGGGGDRRDWSKNIGEINVNFNKSFSGTKSWFR